MDYGTFFFTNIVSLSVFASSVSLLAWHNRKTIGMRWFAASLALVLVKLILQGLEGRVPVVLSGMLANELYFISFVFQAIGVHWFVRRTPIRQKWPVVGILATLIAYTVMFLGHVRYSGNVTNVPSILVCGLTAWMLFGRGRAPVSRVSAFVLSAEMLVMTYRAILTNLRYMRPWETIPAEKDPRWLYSLAAMALLTTCMVMCYLWFLVTELGKELARQARTDSLTGALNRRAMEEAALRETARSIRHKRPLCMIVLDVDHFKQINDARGHAAGDRVLQRLVTGAKNMLRQNDLIARTGGEEFSILLPDTTALECIVAAERLRQAIEQIEVLFHGDPIRFTVSAGIAQLDASNGDWEAMMHRADTAMYVAKQHGRNAVFPDISCAIPSLTKAAATSD